MAEMKFGRIKLFFTVLYRSPAFGHNSPNFQAFLSDFNNLYAKIKSRKILLRHYLQILMLIPSIGGLMVIHLLKALKSNFVCLHWDYLKSFPNRLILSLIKIPQYAKYDISRFFPKNRPIIILRFFISLDLIFMFYGVFLATRNISL